MQQIDKILVAYLLVAVLAKVGSAVAHGAGPGMVITCHTGVGAPPGVTASATVHNAATNVYRSVPIPDGSSSGGVCGAILTAAAQAGLKANWENISAVSIYGAGNSVSVSFASISQQNF